MRLPFDNLTVTTGTQQIVQDELIIGVDGELRFIYRRSAGWIFETLNKFADAHR
jgi:hypothetical protein